MATIDIVILGVYLIGIMALGFFAGKDNKNQDDYFLAGRSMPWIPVALSVAATMVSANSFIGGPGWAYNDGMAPFMVNVTVPLACFFAIWATVPVFYSLKVTSVYEYMEKRLGVHSRNLTVAQFFINSLIQVSSMVFIPSIIIQTMTGWPLYIVVPMIVLCAVIYTLAGGIKAVIWTDAIQMIILWGGMILIGYTAIAKSDISFFETISQASEAGKLNCFDFEFSITKTNAFWTTLIGGSFMWIRYFAFDQCQMQRILTSKSMAGIKKSFASSAVMMNVMYYLMLLGGIFLWSFYDGKAFETSNEIMIGFVLNELPAGVIGLVIAAIFAAAMSSVDSLLNSMTTVFTKDIYERYFKKDKAESDLKLTMKISAVLGVFIIFIVIFGFGGSVKSVLDVVGKYISYFSGPALGAFLMAMFTEKANDKGVTVGFICGIIGGFVVAKIFNTSWLWNPAIGAAITIAIGMIISMLLKNNKNNKSQEEIRKYTAMGIREEMKASGKITEDGVSVVPFKMDKYAVAILAIFFAQYIFLAIVR